MLNHITIMGRLTSDPELKTTTGGSSVTTITVACERDYADGGGNREADFISVVVWKATAEFVAKNFRKGSMIVVDGRLQSRKWEDRDGEKHIAWEVRADRIYFGESKRKDDSDIGSAQAAQKPIPQMSGSKQHSAFEEMSDDDGDLPF